MVHACRAQYNVSYLGFTPNSLSPNWGTPDRCRSSVLTNLQSSSPTPSFPVFSMLAQMLGPRGQGRSHWPKLARWLILASVYPGVCLSSVPEPPPQPPKHQHIRFLFWHRHIFNISLFQHTGQAHRPISSHCLVVFRVSDSGRIPRVSQC